MVLKTSPQLQYRRALLGLVAALKQRASLTDWHNEAEQLKSVCPNTVLLCQVIIHTLSYCTDEREGRLLAEMLILWGDLDHVQQPLWAVITQADATDIAKDFAQLALQALGDATPLTFWLANLQAPRQMIDRETQRMLETVHHQPEALVDFLDFYMALPTQEQESLLDSLAKPINPATAKTEALLSPGIKLLVYALYHHHISNAPLHAHITQLYQTYLQPTYLPHTTQGKSTTHLSADSQLRYQELRHTQELRHSIDAHYCGYLYTGTPDMLKETVIDTCYSSLPDGLGYQIVIIVRKHIKQPSYCVMACVLHDTQGLVDTFGFYNLNANEFWSLIDKTYEGCNKYLLPAPVAKQWLLIARAQNMLTDRPIPYEFSAWQTVLMDIPEWHHAPISPDWVRQDWLAHTHQLLDHPDMQTWNNSFAHSETSPEKPLSIPPSNRYPWQVALSYRLKRVASLFHFQGLVVFRDLAATASQEVLKDCYKNDKSNDSKGFVARYEQ
jgi:hypothetical protein